MGLSSVVPLFLASPRILLWDLRADRRNPPLATLAEESDNERFLWRILPHAARSFALSILCLPRSTARACAVAYLHCRILDSLEDLVSDPMERRAALLSAAERLPYGGALPPIQSWIQQDSRDAVHRLLCEHAAKVDAVTALLSREQQQLVQSLVHEMATGMVRLDVSRGPKGALRSDAALLDYCDTVIGAPLRFCAHLFLAKRHDGAARFAAAAPHIAGASAFLQLANISRDLEKDLARGVVHVPELEVWIQPAGVAPSAGCAQAIAAARLRLTNLALAQRCAFDKAILAVAPGRCSLIRLAAWVLRRNTLCHHSRMLARVAASLLERS